MGTPPAPLKMGLDFLLSGTGDLPSGSHEVPGPPPSVPPPFFEPIPPVDLREPGASQMPHQAQLYQASLSSLVTATGLITPQPRHRCACGSSFNRSLNYLYHIGFGRTSADCDEVDVALYPCVVPGCDSAFRRKTDQAKHHSCVHSKSRPFKCGAATCDSAFFFRKDLHKHIATVHLKERPYKCNSCDQAFGKKEHLKNHINRTHLRIKPYGCSVCNVRLASKHNLESHVKTRAHIRAEALMRQA